MPDFDLDELFASVGKDVVDGAAATLSSTPVGEPPAAPLEVPAAAAVATQDDDSGSSLADYMGTVGVQVQKTVPDILRPWMTAHRFFLVQTIAELEGVVEKALETGKCSLDLETEGLDNRIYPDAEGVPRTVHKIVGYCLCPDGETGYYVPVRHKAPDAANLDPGRVAEVIRKLCLAAQPKLSPKGLELDPLASRDVEEPSKVTIYFWHAKFDQEFLYGEIGLDWWHPDSFEDGMLMFFCHYSADRSLGLKAKAKERLRVPVPIISSEKDLRKSYADGDNIVKVQFIGDPKAKRVLAPYEMIEMSDLFPRGRNVRFETLHPQEALVYGASDGICTYKLCQDKEIVEFLKKDRNTFIYRIEKQVVQVIRRMERNRVKLDMPYVRELFERAKKEAAEYETKIIQLAESKGFFGFDIRSAKQLGEFLFGDNGLNITPKPDRNEKSGQYKTDADTLEGLVKTNPNAPEVLTWVVKFREIDKIVGTYLSNMSANADKNHEMRVQFKQTGAATGRFSAPSGDPEHGYSGVPIHGIPGTSDPTKPKVATALRKAIIAREGYLMVKCDYSGEELRIAANLSQEPVWVKEFLHGTGDLHSITARAIFGKAEVSKDERQAGKRTNFALLYGGGPSAIVRATGCTREEGARRKSSFDKSVPGFSKWVRDNHAMVKKTLGVHTSYGRWVAIPDGNSQDQATRAACERHCINYQIQGTGADVMKVALVLLHKEFYKRGWLQDDHVRMLLTVHDEVVLEVRKEMLRVICDVIRERMEYTARFANGGKGWPVPLIAEPLVDTSWTAKYDYEKIYQGRPAEGDAPKEKDHEVVYNGRIYVVGPNWLKEDPPPVMEGEDGALIYRDGGQGEAPVRITPLTVTTVAPTPEPSPEAQQAVVPPVLEDITAGVDLDLSDEVPAQDTTVIPKQPPTQHSASVPAPTQGSQAAIQGDVAVFRVAMTTRNAVVTVGQCCWVAKDPDGPLLHLVNALGETLIDPSLGIRINPDTFRTALVVYNL